MPVSAGEFTVFGPQSYVRGPGPPVTEVRRFSVINPRTTYTLRIDNGRSTERSVDGEVERVSSSVIRINGAQVVGPGDLNQNVGHLERDVSLEQANRIEVELRGRPGGGITIRIVGEDHEPPVVTAIVDPAPNAAGWNATDVTVGFSCSDAISGVASVSPPVIVTAEGEGQVVTGTCVDRAGNTASVRQIVNLDKTRPQLSIEVPAIGQFLPRSPVTVRGTVQDATAITALAADGMTGTVAEGAFAIDVAIAPGPNTIEVAATDTAGNVGRAAVSVTLDADPPVITLAEPAEGAVTNQSAISVMGSIVETGILASAELACDGIPPQPLTLSDGHFAAHCGLSVEGPLTVRITARDAADNTASVERTVTYDVTPPTVTITQPVGEVTNRTSLSVQGTVDDPQAVVTVNGLAAVVSEGRFGVVGVPLEEGPNMLTVLATDAAGNTRSLTRTIIRDTVPPRVKITTPAAGVLLSVTDLAVSGTVDDPAATISVNGTPATVGNGIFTVSVPIPEGPVEIKVRAFDPAGNEAFDMGNVTIDRTPPYVTASAPSEVTAGAPAILTGLASDPNGIDRLEFSVSGVLIAAPSGERESLPYTVPPSATTGTLLSLEVAAYDRAGNRSAASATMNVTAPSAAPGFVEGEVYDDTTGLPLAEAQVTVVGPASAPILADPQGRYVLTREAGPVILQITKSGYTVVDRIVPVQAAEKVIVFDARLIPRAALVSIPTDGGRITQGTATLLVPPGVVTVPAALQLTPLSPQGLPARLPLGWSPVAAVEIAPSEASFATPAQLNWEKLPGGPLTFAAYDQMVHQWRVEASPVTVPASGYVTLPIPRPGVYVLLAADIGLTAPPPIMGQTLTGYTLNKSPAGLAATGRVVPRAAAPGAGPRATGHLSVTASSPLPSGYHVAVRVMERQELRSGEQVFAPEHTQDIILYALSPQGRGEGEGFLSATFPLTPSRPSTLAKLLLGTITLDVLTAEEPIGGTRLDGSGGTLTTPDGWVLVVPIGALEQPTSARLIARPASPVPLPATLTFLGAVEVDLTQARLSRSATLSLPVPAVYRTGAGPILIARVVTIQNAQRLALVGIGRSAGGLITSTTRLGGLSFPGIQQGGLYLFLQASGPVGYLTSTVTGRDGMPAAGALVTIDTLPFAHLTDGIAPYIVAGTVGVFTIAAQDLAQGDATAATGAVVTPDQVISLPLHLSEVSLWVEQITPSDGATNVPITTEVTARFNRPIDPASLTGQLSLTDGTTTTDGLLVVAPGNAAFTFYPRELKSATAYTFEIGAAVRDVRGRTLGTAVRSTFTTRRTVPPPRPPAAQMSVSFPNDQGLVTITATQGTVDPTHTVVLLNLDTGETVKVTVLPDGSFTARIAATLGDQLQLLIRDSSGNQTIADPGPYRDTAGRTLLSPRGGTVPGSDGLHLSVPAGALKVPALITVTPLLESQLPTPIPAGYSFVAAVRIESGGIRWSAEAQLSLPVPPDFPAGAHPFVVSPRTLADGQIHWAILTTAKIVGASITSATPPFPGITGPGTYVFVAAPPDTTQLVVSGTAFRDANGNGIYDGPDLGVDGGLVGAGAFTRDALPSFFAPTNATGQYAIPLFFPSSGTGLIFDLTAIDALGILTRTATGSADLTQSANVKLDFLLEDLLARRQQDLESPAVSLRTSGPGLFSGTAALNSIVAFTLEATDDLAVAQVALSINGQAQTLTPAGLGTGRVSAEATWPVSEVGSYTIVVAARDLSGHLTTQQMTLQVVAAGQLPAAIPNTPPQVLTAGISPQSGAFDLNVDELVVVPFSEPVDAGPQNLFLSRKVDGGVIPVSYETDLSGGAFSVVLRPRGLLEYGTEYEIVLTNRIQDGEGKALEVLRRVAFTTMKLEVAGQRLLPETKGHIFNSEHLVILDGQEGVVTMDVSDAARPEVVGTQPLPGVILNAVGLGAERGEAVVVGHKWVSGTIGSTISSFEPWLAFQSGGAVTGIDYNLQVPITELWGMLRLVDVSDPAQPQFVRGTAITWPPLQDAQGALGPSPGEGIPKKVVVHRDYAYVAVIPSGIFVVDLKAVRTRTTLRQPTVVGTVQPGAVPLDLAILGDTLLVLTRQGLVLYDLAIPEAPQEAGRLAISGAFRIGVLQDYEYPDPATGQPVTVDLAFIGTGKGELVVLNVTERTFPRVVSRIKLSDFAVGPSVAAGSLRRVAVGDLFHTLWVVDITDPAHPARIGELAGEVVPRHLVMDDRAVVWVDDGEKGVGLQKVGRFLLLDLLNAIVRGAAADGVTELIVVLEGQGLSAGEQLLVTLSAEPGTAPEELGVLSCGGLATCSGSGTTVTVQIRPEHLTDKGFKLQLRYRAPDVLVRADPRLKEKDQGSPARYVLVTGRKGDARGAAVVRSRIELRRPPVLLVHGLWGDSATWDQFEPLLQRDINPFFVVRADYSRRPYNNAGRLSQNYQVIEQYLRRAEGEASKDKIAATKVDIVAHSMGGLITREYCRQRPSCTEQIHKLITLDTPFRGSGLARLLAQTRDRENRLTHPLEHQLLEGLRSGGCTPEGSVCRPLGGAIDDLVPDSPALSILPQLFLPVHTIVGTSADGVLGHNRSLADLWDGIARIFTFVPDTSFNLNSGCGIRRRSSCTAFWGNERSDRIVTLSSQAGGLIAPHVDVLQGMDHTTVHERQDVADRVRELLELPVRSTEFSPVLAGEP